MQDECFRAELRQLGCNLKLHLSTHALLASAGWGARDRTWECRYQKPMPYRLATPQSWQPLDLGPGSRGGGNIGKGPAESKASLAERALAGAGGRPYPYRFENEAILSKNPEESEIAAGPDRRRTTASPAVVRPLRLGTAERLVPQPQTSSSALAHPMIWAAIVLGAALVVSVLLWQETSDKPITPVTARSEILAIEQMLDALAFTPGIVDGIADNATVAAIREFQRLAGLPEDGLATPALLEELRAVTRAE